jgi:hypothetical protein
LPAEKALLERERECLLACVDALERQKAQLTACNADRALAYIGLIEGAADKALAFDRAAQVRAKSRQGNAPEDSGGLRAEVAALQTLVCEYTIHTTNLLGEWRESLKAALRSIRQSPYFSSRPLFTRTGRPAFLDMKV